jgi:signal peptidase I
MALLAMFSFRSAIADWNDVPTGSMRPTIVEGDRIAVNRMAYDLRVPFTTLSMKRLDDPQRGEIAVLHSPVDGTRLVKRVVGLPGDTIALRGTTLLVNGRPADFGVASHSSRFGPVRVPENHYFVMGDNRDESRDSRSFGAVPRDAFMGRAFGIVFSRDPGKILSFRRERFFADLE